MGGRVRYLPASLASTHWRPITSPSAVVTIKIVSRYYQDIPWEAQAAPVRTTASVQCLLQLSTRMHSQLGDLRTPQKEDSVWLELKEWIDFWWAIMEAFLEEHEPKRCGKYREMDRAQRATKLILKWGRRRAWGERERGQAANKVEAPESHITETLKIFHSIFADFLGVHGGCKGKV